jgi:hypothetical protein
MRIREQGQILELRALSKLAGKEYFGMQFMLLGIF